MGRLLELSPAWVACTHAPPLSALALERRRGGPSWPLAGVVTDFQVHAYWAEPEADLLCAASEEAAEALVEGGVPRSKVALTGIPIDPVFSRPRGRAEARRGLDLPEEGPVILLSGGSRGLGRLPEAAQALRAALPRAWLVAACGQNPPLAGRLRALGDPRLRVHSGLDPLVMRELMAASDLLVGKAGGVTAAEALACGLAQLFFEPLPGQEERNAAYLAGRGAAARAEGLAALGERARRLLAGEGQALAERARSLARPRAAFDALSRIAGLTASGATGILTSDGSQDSRRAGGRLRRA